MSRQRFTTLLGELAQAGSDAGARHDEITGALTESLYPELKQIAARLLARERREHTLAPTALVHEAYLKLVDHDRVRFRDRRHFLAFAARLIRQILVDHARAHNRVKRGGGSDGWQRVTLSRDRETADDAGAAAAIDVLDLEQALVELERLDERHARVVELRFFSELTIPEIADLLGVSEGTVKNDWRAARSWLEVRLG